MADDFAARVGPLARRMRPGPPRLRDADEHAAALEDAGEQPMDWEALAARVLAFYEATGSWGLLSDWLSKTPRDAPHGGTAADWHL